MKSVCRQKYSQIRLKTVVNGMIGEDSFYFPSHCTCELVNVKRSNESEQKNRFEKSLFT